jgi:hypothetical protein
MLVWSLILFSVVSEPTVLAAQPEFLSSWAKSDYQTACAQLDQNQIPLIQADWLETASKLRVRCGKEALGVGKLKQAHRQLQSCLELDIDDSKCLELRQLIDGWEALTSARKGRLGPALTSASGVPRDHWPKGLPVELLRGGQEALKNKRLQDAEAALSLLEAQAPQTFGLSELRSSIWWATKGGAVAFRIALIAFVLLLALTARSLLHTRRRTKALLSAEIQS